VDDEINKGTRIRHRESGELGYSYGYENIPGSKHLICYMDKTGGCVLHEDEVEFIEPSS
jgi:hypothetical protein